MFKQLIFSLLVFCSVLLGSNALGEKKTTLKLRVSDGLSASIEIPTQFVNSMEPHRKPYLELLEAGKHDEALAKIDQLIGETDSLKLNERERRYRLLLLRCDRVSALVKMGRFLEALMETTEARKFAKYQNSSELKKLLKKLPESLSSQQLLNNPPATDDRRDSAKVMQEDETIAKEEMPEEIPEQKPEVGFTRLQIKGKEFGSTLVTLDLPEEVVASMKPLRDNYLDDFDGVNEEVALHKMDIVLKETGQEKSDVEKYRTLLLRFDRMKAFTNMRRYMELLAEAFQAKKVAVSQYNIDQLDNLLSSLPTHLNELQLLQLPPMPLVMEATRAYRRMTIMLHPDRYRTMSEKDVELAEAIFARIKLAYEDLMKPPAKEAQASD